MNILITIIPAVWYLNKYANKVIKYEQYNNCLNNITLNKVNVKQCDNCINGWLQSYIILEYEI